MFDELGRVVCEKCGGRMTTVDVDDQCALFACQNMCCNHIQLIEWQPPRPQREYAEAA